MSPDLGGVWTSGVSTVEYGTRMLDPHSHAAALAAALKVSEIGLVSGPHVSAERHRYRQQRTKQPGSAEADQFADFRNLLRAEEVDGCHTKFTCYGKVSRAVIHEHALIRRQTELGECKRVDLGLRFA